MDAEVLPITTALDITRFDWKQATSSANRGMCIRRIKGTLPSSVVHRATEAAKGISYYNRLVIFAFFT